MGAGDYQPRNLRPFKKPKEENKIPPHVLRRRSLCKKFVESEFWPLLDEMLSEFIGSFAVFPALGGEKLHGYLEFSLLRDRVSQFLTLIIQEAELAPKED